MMIFDYLYKGEGWHLDKKTSADWHPIKGVLLVLFVLGLLGTGFFFFKYDDVFPAACVDLKLSKQEIASRARSLCESLGYVTKDCVESTTFQERSDSGDKPGPSTFLEHEYSMREANALMHSDICVYFWYTRFCKPQQNEEFQIWLAPDGKLAALNHDIEKEQALPSISQEEAMQLALRFVRDRAGVALYDGDLHKGKTPQLAEGIKLIRAGSINQSQRTDHYFTWEDQKHDYKGAHLRTVVYVSGNQVTTYDRDLHIPEAFERKYANMRSYNNLLKSISSVLFAVVAAGIFFAFVWAVSTRKLRWKLALVAAAVAFTIQIIEFWNNWSSLLQSYSTGESLQGYLVSKLVSSLLSAGITALAAMILVGGLEAVYRKGFPGKIACEHLLNWKMLSNRTLLESILAGIFVLGIHLGYVAVYYLAGQKLGFWSPLELRDVSTISSISPAFSSFNVGVHASVVEELLYRVLCFYLAQRLFKNFWIANLIQAAGWAFIHSDYPQEPAYARGVELTIVGLFYGYLIKRFGVLTCIISHFMYDAFLGITPLLFARSAALSATGFLACSPPLVALGIGLWRRRKGEDLPDQPLLNENLIEVRQQPQLQAQPEKPLKGLAWAELSSRLKAGMLLVCLVAAAACLFIHPRSFGGWARIRVSQADIEKTAAKFLRDRGVDEADWQVSSVLSSNTDNNEIQYGFEKLGFEKTEKLIRQGRVPMIWWVRFFKQQQKREYDVAVSSDGRPIALRVLDDENADGKLIKEADALKLTGDFLERYRPEFLPLKFDTAIEQKRKNRADFTVSYVVPDLKMGDARLKIDIETVGGLVSFPHVVWDIPDSWIFERSKLTLKDNAARIVSQVYLVLLSACGLLWAIGVFRSQPLPWKPVLAVAAVSGVFTLLSQANESISNMAGYDTSVPFYSSLTELAVRGLTHAILYAAFFAGLFAVGYGAFRLAFPDTGVKAVWKNVCGLVQPEGSRTRQLWLDGLWAASTWLLAATALEIINSFLEGKFSPQALILPVQNLISLTRYSSPAAEQITNALGLGFMVLCLAPAAILIYRRYIKTFSRYLLFSFISLLIIESTKKYWQDYLREVGVGCVEVVIFYLWVKYCARNNPLAYFLAGALMAIQEAIYYLFRFSTVHTMDLVILCAFFALPFVTPFFFRQDNAEKVAVNQ